MTISKRVLVGIVAYILTSYIMSFVDGSFLVRTLLGAALFGVMIGAGFSLLQQKKH